MDQYPIKDYCLRLPVWYKAASEGTLVVISFASVERLFSILSSQVHDSQSRALSDYQIAALFLRYNNNSRLQTSTIVVLLFFRRQLNKIFYLFISPYLQKKFFYYTKTLKEKKMLNTGGIFSPEVAFFLLQQHLFSARSHYFATFGGIIWVLMLSILFEIGSRNCPMPTHH